MTDLFGPVFPRDIYRLPEGNVQIAFSGGRTSAYLLRQILDHNDGIPDRALVTFQNTGREMDETLNFVRDVGQRWNVGITWLEYRPRKPLEDWQFDLVVSIFGEAYAAKLAAWWRPEPKGFAQVDFATAARDGEPFVALIFLRRFLPNVRARFCTIEMKVRTAKRYMVANGWKRWTNAVGLRADEPRRLNKPPPKDRWTVWHPLATAGVTKEIIGKFWNDQPFDLELPNVAGKCWLGNCDGCFLKAEASIVRLGVEHPNRALWWEHTEALATALSNATGQEPGRGAWFSKRYTREEMRIYSGKRGKQALSVDGLLCQKDDGDCTG